MTTVVRWRRDGWGPPASTSGRSAKKTPDATRPLTKDAERCYRKRQQILDLERYLDALERKPGALADSMPLAQWRSQGRWPTSYDLLWQRMIERLGRDVGCAATGQRAQFTRW